MRASLPMYDWPEIRSENDQFWYQLRQAVLSIAPTAPTALDAKLPALRDNTASLDIMAHWQSQDLVFSQTCWGPLSLGLINQVDILAQPDYTAFPGGRGPFYRSAIIACEGKSAAVPETASASDLSALCHFRRFAYNHKDSLSGYIGLVEDYRDQHGQLPNVKLETGSHRASVRAIINGEADMAAIDCRSWALAQTYEAEADKLTVVGWTQERLGLPFISSKKTDTSLKCVLRSALLELGCYHH